MKANEHTRKGTPVRLSLDTHHLGYEIYNGREGHVIQCLDRLPLMEVRLASPLHKGEGRRFMFRPSSLVVLDSPVFERGAEVVVREGRYASMKGVVVSPGLASSEVVVGRFASWGVMTGVQRLEFSNDEIQKSIPEHMVSVNESLGLPGPKYMVHQPKYRVHQVVVAPEGHPLTIQGHFLSAALGKWMYTCFDEREARLVTKGEEELHPCPPPEEAYSGERVQTTCTGATWMYDDVII